MRAKPRINWLLRQLSDAPYDLQVEIHYPNTRVTTAELLSAARENPDLLLNESDPRKEPKAFTLTWSRPMGQKRGKEADSFVGSTLRQTVDFYRDLVQNLVPWQAKAPKMKAADTSEPPPEAPAHEVVNRPSDLQILD